MKLKNIILEKYPEFFKELDPNFKLFAREIKKELRDEGHVIIAITGYPNTGKSNMGAILGLLIDDNYEFDVNICFIPTAEEIAKQYLDLPMYSYLHIDEATRSMHKHQWYESVQQKLNELYDTEREGHFLCTALIMPRFQNFTENFRNFMIKYWINLPVKGLAVFFKRDEDKDCKDPWHLDENYKSKKVKWRGKRVFERDLPNQIRAEQVTECYWFYCQVPPIPKDVWSVYQDLKKKSRDIKGQSHPEVETPREKAIRERKERMDMAYNLYKQGYTKTQIAVKMGISPQAITQYFRLMRADMEVRNKESSQALSEVDNNNTIIYNQDKKPSTKEIPEEFDKI